MYTFTASTHMSLSHVSVMCWWRGRLSWFTPGGGAWSLNPSLGRAWPAWWHHLSPGCDAATSRMTSFDGSTTSSNISGHNGRTSSRISSSRGGRRARRGRDHPLWGVSLFNWVGKSNSTIICWTESPLSSDTVMVMLVHVHYNTE